jgi:hypothetical protein
MSSVSYAEHYAGTHSGAQLCGAKPVQRFVSNVVNEQTAQEQAEVLEQAVLDAIAAAEADQLQKEQEAANLFGQRAEIAVALDNSKPGDVLKLSDGTIVHRR